MIGGGDPNAAEDTSKKIFETLDTLKKKIEDIN